MTDPDPDKTLHAASPNSPPIFAITQAICIAKESPCRSKRGVIIYDPCKIFFVSSHNGPPEPFICPGRDRCRGKCSQLAVHAETRALRCVAGIGRRDLELVHVELAPEPILLSASGFDVDRSVIACNGPSCVSCSKEILDAQSIAGIWLYEIAVSPNDGAAWRRYSAVEFHRSSLERCGLPS